MQNGSEGAAGRTLRVILEYAGEQFAGWQVQPEARTVQGELERALAEVLRHPVRVTGASRTDAGVHALGQVASFETASAIACDKLRAGLNALLPQDVAVSVVDEVPAGFSARFSALGKHYRYRILARAPRSPLHMRDAWHIPQPLDLTAMREAAAHLVGTHDFQAFVSKPDGLQERLRRGDGDCTRTLRAVDVSSEPAPGAGGGELVTVDVVGDAFLYKMVRTIVGTLVQVARGRRPSSDLRGLIASGDRRRAGPTAPAHGLTLMRVAYAPGELPGHDARSEVVSEGDARGRVQGPGERHRSTRAGHRRPAALCPGEGGAA